MERYTNDGIHFFYEGGAITLDNVRYCCVTKEWYISHGYYPYKTVEEDGTDGVVDNHFVHYKGKPCLQPTPEPYVPTEEELEAIRKQVERQSILSQIESLKTQLSSTDYKVIKCTECQLVGEESPYDITEVHQERQSLRDQINTLEESLNNI